MSNLHFSVCILHSGVVSYLGRLFGPENVVDAQDLSCRVKYEKSDDKMRLIRDANVIAGAMIRVALRGIGNRWDDVVIPGLDFVVAENTLGKFGPRVEELNAVPHHAQPLVGVRRVAA